MQGYRRTFGWSLWSCVAVATAVAVLASGRAAAGGQGTALVRLQSTTPGSIQTGHFNISGTAKAGIFAGSGSGLVGVPWTSITGAPSAFPPNGAAGGDLTGTYPNPTLATLASSLAKVSGNWMKADALGVSAGPSGPTAIGSANFIVNDGTTGFGGMYINTSGTGQPFYGYAHAGSFVGWHEIDQTGTWKLYNDGYHVAVSNTGMVGVQGVTAPAFPLSFASTLGDKIALWGQSGNHYGLGIQSATLQIHTDGPGSDVAFGWGSSASFNETMRVKGNGLVGIGLNPNNGGQKLQISGGMLASGSLLSQSEVRVINGDGAARFSGYIAGDTGIAEWGTPTAWRGLYAGPNTGGGQYMGALNDAGNAFTGGLYKTGDTTTFLSATSKSFVEVNPDDPSTDIIYTCIEGGEAAMYCRGTGRLTNGRATIELPSHFRALAQEGTLTVILTPMSLDTRGMGFTRKSLDGIEVGELGGGTSDYEFDWEVKAVRARFKNYEVERPWTNRLPPDSDPKQAWQERLRAFEKDKSIRRP